MKSMKKAIALAVMSLAAIGSQAATQGVADVASSVATFTNQIGAITTRQVRIFGVQDATMMPGVSTTVDSALGTFPGVMDGFCVADSTGGAVRVTFTSAGLTAGVGPVMVATSATTGTINPYVQSISVNNGAWNAIAVGANTFDVPAGVTQTDVANCTTPNVRKSLIDGNGTAATFGDVWTDLVTLTATPL